MNDCDRKLVMLQARNRELASQLQELSAAYLRLRQIIGGPAFDTPTAPSAQVIWETTEFALRVALGQEQV
jgi:hypothetical protein